MVRVARLERAASTSQMWRPTNWATPGYLVSDIIPWKKGKSKIFLFVVIYVVKAAFALLSAILESPVNAGVARLCDVWLCPVPDTATAHPNQARYHLRYTRICNSDIIPWKMGKSKFFLSVFIPVVKAALALLSAIGGNPANAGAARLCGVSPCPAPDTATALPNLTFYQLSYTRNIDGSTQKTES